MDINKAFQTIKTTQVFYGHAKATSGNDNNTRPDLENYQSSSVDKYINSKETHIVDSSLITKTEFPVFNFENNNLTKLSLLVDSLPEISNDRNYSDKVSHNYNLTQDYLKNPCPLPSFISQNSSVSTESNTGSSYSNYSCGAKQNRQQTRQQQPEEEFYDSPTKSTLKQGLNDTKLDSFVLELETQPSKSNMNNTLTKPKTSDPFYDETHPLFYNHHYVNENVPGFFLKKMIFSYIPGNDFLNSIAFLNRRINRIFPMKLTKSVYHEKLNKRILDSATIEEINSNLPNLVDYFSIEDFISKGKPSRYRDIPLLIKFEFDSLQFQNARNQLKFYINIYNKKSNKLVRAEAISGEMIQYKLDFIFTAKKFYKYAPAFDYNNKISQTSVYSIDSLNDYVNDLNNNEYIKSETHSKSLFEDLTNKDNVFSIQTIPSYPGFFVKIETYFINVN